MFVEFSQNRSNSARSWTKLAESCQIWPNSSQPKFGRFQAKFGLPRHRVCPNLSKPWPDFDRPRCLSAQIRPQSARTRPNLSNIDPDWSHFSLYSEKLRGPCPERAWFGSASCELDSTHKLGLGVDFASPPLVFDAEGLAGVVRWERRVGSIGGYRWKRAIVDWSQLCRPLFMQEGATPGGAREACANAARGAGSARGRRARLANGARRARTGAGRRAPARRRAGGARTRRAPPA